MEDETATLPLELAMVEHQRTATGQLRRRRGRDAEYTKKRKQLESLDQQETILVSTSKKRTRGSKAAHNPEVVEGSHLKTAAGATHKRQARKRNNNTQFSSQRLARMHGDAMGLHSQGKSLEAIEKLKELAEEAPLAPQVYSSLGMVRASLLNELPDDTEETLAERIELAEKAHASYHVAAILCIKDYQAWVRAADMAAELASLTDSRRWWNEAKKEYESADRLRPPGNDVPAKLAHAYIQLGCLSEALTVVSSMQHDYFATWMLAADLMLRVGFECERWNAGDDRHENYMFRRWLRKHSKTFDWKERRLQALVMAFESAVGSDQCQALVTWWDQRVVEWNGSKKPSAIDNETQDADADEDLAVLQLNQQSELDDFDKTTLDMELNAESIPAQQRAAERQNLIERQKEAARILMEGATGEDDDTPREVASTSHDLPMAASRHRVLDIAMELSMHLVLVEELPGVRFVGDAVASYFKARVTAMDRRALRQQQLEESIEETELFPLPGTTTTANNYDNESDEEDVAFLSDDEGFQDQIPSEHLDSMRRGWFMPPQLKFMYGLGLLGQGDRDFVAQKCLETFHLLPNDALPEEGSGGSDAAWDAFRTSRSCESLSKTQSLAILSDALRYTGKESKLVDFVSPIFSAHVEWMTESGIVAKLPDARDTDDPIVRRMADNYLKVLGASARADLSRSTTIAKKEGSATFEALAESIRRCLPLLEEFWRVEDDGSIDSFAMDFLRTIGYSTQSVVHSSKVHSDTPGIAQLVDVMTDLVSMMSESSRELLLQVPEKSQFDKLGSFPFPRVSALFEQRKGVSRLAHNLAISLSVSYFSGWESSEFSVRLMRARSVPRFFGISSVDENTLVYVGDEVEDEICSQWALLVKLLPSASHLKIKAKLGAIRQHPKCIEMKERCVASKSSDIILFAEDSGFQLMLAFSRLCLLAAQSKTAASRSTDIVNAVSIICPVTELVLGCKLWKASSKRARPSAKDPPHQTSSLMPMMMNPSEAAAMAAYHSLAYDMDPQLPSPRGVPLSPMPLLLPPQSPQQAQIRQKKRKPPTQNRTVPLGGAYKLCDWFEWEALNDPLSNIPCAAIRCFDSMLMSAETSSQIRDGALLGAMQAVTEAMARLRRCLTETATQKACLKVAHALVRLASCPGARNPVSCLEQASQFCRMAPKGGTGDQFFKQSLPPVSACSPLEALVILGRADCLQSIGFFEEAAYLCSTVTGYCASNRQKDTAEGLWEVVSAQAYNTSVKIRFAASSCCTAGQASFAWETAVVAELREGRIFANRFVENRHSSGSSGLPHSSERSSGSDMNESSAIETQLVRGSAAVSVTAL